MSDNESKKDTSSSSDTEDESSDSSSSGSDTNSDTSVPSSEKKSKKSKSADSNESSNKPNSPREVDSTSKNENVEQESKKRPVEDEDTGNVKKRKTEDANEKSENNVEINSTNTCVVNRDENNGKIDLVDEKSSDNENEKSLTPKRKEPEDSSDKVTSKDKENNKEKEVQKQSEKRKGNEESQNHSKRQSKRGHSDDRDRRKRSRDRRRSRSREDRRRSKEKESSRRRNVTKSRKSRSPRRERSRSPINNSKQQEGKKNDKDSATINDVEKSSEKISERQRRTVDLLTSRTGGAYIPPAKLRMLQSEITDKTSAAYQRIAWEALKKSIHGYINKVNVDNIAIITRELLKENIIRGRGLLCRSIIQAQAASPTFTHVYAALVAIINSKFPNIGELLLKRLVIQFKRGFRRNDKNLCISSSRFIAHLVNQRMAHEILALEILTLLVETPTDDSVEVAIAFLKECGMKLTEVSSKGINAIFEMLKNILHEGKLDKRVQYMIEVVFQVRKDGFKDHQSVIEALELVEEDDQFTHLIMLDEATDGQDALNVFKFDDKYETNEDKYKGLSKEILGSDASDSESGSSESGSENSDDEAEDGDKEKADVIIDNTETNLVALRRTIYLTIHSSLDYEECAHKLMKMQLKPGQEMELCHMFLDCCAEQRTYEKFYGLLAQRFCMINNIYVEPFEEIFKDTYHTTHRLDTNRLRNVSKFFAHLLFTDAIGWDVLECIKLNEDDTTSSSRIFIKILFQELAEYMGLSKLNERLKDPTLTESFAGLFPRDNPRNTRFAINFFTSIGLGGLTDELREFLKSAPKSVPAINQEILTIKSSSDSSSTSSSSSSSSSDSSSESDSDSSSDSDSDSEKRRSKKKRKQKGKKKQRKHNKKKNESSDSSSEESSEEEIRSSKKKRNKDSRKKAKKHTRRDEGKKLTKKSNKRKKNKYGSDIEQKKSSEKKNSSNHRKGVENETEKAHTRRSQSMDSEITRREKHTNSENGRDRRERRSPSPSLNNRTDHRDRQRKFNDVQDYKKSSNFYRDKNRRRSRSREVENDRKRENTSRKENRSPVREKRR